MYIRVQLHSPYLQVVCKKVYGHSARDDGTLGFFRSCNTVTADVKKAVDDTLDFWETVVKGHFLATACTILGINSIRFNCPSASSRQIQVNKDSISIMLQTS